jgi:DNA mismatch endonuclease, patch repair protein
VVFIDGCWWHGCPEHGARETLRNEYYWRPKIALNRERDARQMKALEGASWVAVRFWEHEEPTLAVRVIRDLLAQSYAAASSRTVS